MSATARPARRLDGPRILALLREADLEAWFVPEEFVVAEDAGRVVACARLKPLPGGEHELASVAVAREARGRGVGSVVTRAALARSSGRVHALALAPTFFERHGFRAVAAPPPALAEKVATVCASKGFVPMVREGGDA